MELNRHLRNEPGAAESRCSCTPPLTSVVVFVTGDKLSLFLPLSGENHGSRLLVIGRHSFAGFLRVSQRESDRPWDRCSPWLNLMYCHTVQTWLPNRLFWGIRGSSKRKGRRN